MSDFWQKIVARLFSRRPGRPETPAGFEYDFVLRLIRLIGNTYVEYFATRYGPRPEDWKPVSARANYERYLPATTPAGYESLCTINLVGGESRWPIGRILRAKAAENEFYLVFRGTVSEEEWIKDVLVMQTENPVSLPQGTPGGRVHLGFARMFRRLDPPPEAWAEYLGVSSQHSAGTSAGDANGAAGIRLHIAGHSLGGALGTLAALHFHRLRPTLWSFGSPRPGDPVFAASFNALVPDAHRCANHWDPIIDLPDSKVDLIFRKYAYAHVGRHTPIFALSQMNGPSLAKIVDENESWRDWKDYVLDTLLDPASGHRIDPLFAHQLRCYEYAIDRDRRLAAE